MSLPLKTFLASLNSDTALGAVGTGLAIASVCFGVYMNVHGPAASFGHSKEFPIFAQMKALQRQPQYIIPADGGEPNPTKSYKGNPAPKTEDLDTTATASIPDATRGGPLIGANTTILANMAVRAATEESATLLIDGRERTVRIGDTVPDAGEVLEIWPGRRPTVRTSYGLIISRGN